MGSPYQYSKIIEYMDILEEEIFQALGIRLMSNDVDPTDGSMDVAGNTLTIRTDTDLTAPDEATLEQVVSDHNPTDGVFDTFGNSENISDLGSTHNISMVSRETHRCRGILTEDCSLDASNFKLGDSIMLMIAQDPTGGHVLSFDSKFKWSGGTPPTFTTTANAMDTFIFMCGVSDIHIHAFQLDVK